MADVPKQYIPPRALRNKTALDKYLAENKITSLFPAIENQHFCYKVAGIAPGAYNPSIIRFRGRLVMVFRFHETTLKTKLGIVELDEKFNVVSGEALQLDEDETLSTEDPRLFIWKGELWLSYVLSTWPNFPSSQVKICRLYKPDRWRFSDKDQYYLPDRQTMEKNHLPIIHDDVFNIVYRSNQPQEGNPSDLSQIIYSPFEKREMKTPALRWAYGEIRGGTVPLPYDGKLISFFHSSLSNDMPPNRQRYYWACVLRKAEPPFQMLAVSKKPILYGSEDGGDKSRFHFKPNVIIPYGSIQHKAGWLISAGINDSECALIEIFEKDLNL